jgi:uncharacterized protein
VSGHRPAARRNSARRLERCDAPSATARLLIWTFQRVNALKNAGRDCEWGGQRRLHRRRGRGLGAGALVAAGSVAGAQLAARYGRPLSPQALRAVIVVVGIAAIVKLVT